VDAKHLQVTETLKDGTVVTIRAIRPDDKSRIAAAFRNLEADSIYTRFFRFKSELTEEELRDATEVDFERTVALVVTIPALDGEETIIGAGRYVLYNPPIVLRRAEVSFIVEEDYQGKGIAGRILKHLIQVAREKGVVGLEAEVLRENTAMLAVFARSGLPLEKSYEDGVFHVTLILAPEGSSKESPTDLQS
jgi:RimJ/RimL family protein N-acetyltransferase